MGLLGQLRGGLGAPREEPRGGAAELKSEGHWPPERWSRPQGWLRQQDRGPPLAIDPPFLVEDDPQSLRPSPFSEL